MDDAPDPAAPLSDGKTSVAIIEDDDEIRLSTQFLLEAHDYSATSYKCAEEFFAASEKYDFIVLDLRLPGLSGLELFERIKTENPTTPVIVVSSLIRLWEARAIKARGDLVLEKPLSAGDLLASLDRLSLKN